MGVLVIILLSAMSWYWHALSPLDAANATRTVVKIPSGASAEDVAELLASGHLIRSPLAFILYVRLHHAASSLKAGGYVLKPSLGVPAVVEQLTTGETGEEIVTIPEGFTVGQIDELLTVKGITQPGELVECAQTCDFSSFDFLPSSLKGNSVHDAPGGRLEGYLSPDTYYVSIADFQTKFFLERLLTTFRHRVVEALGKDIKVSHRSLHQLMTMASLVEEETRRDGERTAVAGILWKRLDAGIGLGVDAAVRYGLGKPTGVLSSADLASASLYNLRKFTGLPPGPITNPSKKSILAVLHPQQSPYFYYLHDHDGQIHYAVTNDEHNLNRQKYLQ